MRNLGRVKNGAPRDLERGLVRVAESIIGDAKEITPVDTGALRASGHVRKPTRDVRGMKVELGFGGPAVDYAIPVHERTDVRHKPPGQAKFLEKAVRKHSPTMADRLRRGLDRAIRAKYGAR